MGRVESWIFDLDNTLYAAEHALWSEIHDRMNAWIAHRLALPEDEAARLRHRYYQSYGTSLRGLMIEHGVEPEEFLEFVHDVDHTVLTADDRLRRALVRLPGRRLVFTNGSLRHARKVLEHLELADVFHDIFDIRASDYVPKPQRVTYEVFLKEHRIDPHTAVMFEDLPRNLEVPAQMGMTTVLVVPEGTTAEVCERWRNNGQKNGQKNGQEKTHVHHVTEDLAGFLEACLDNPPDITFPCRL